MLPVEREPGFVVLTAASNPFRVSRDIVMVREGGSLADMLREAQPDPVLAYHAKIFINGHTIERENWHRVFPKEGTHVEIRVLPSGGGGGGQKNIMRSVLMLAVMAMAIFIPPLMAGSVILGFTIGSTAMAVAGAVISVAGSILVNTLVPVRPPKLRNDNEQPVFGIETARNRAAPFSAVPQVLGRHRVSPNLGAASHTEILGQDQYLRMLFVWGVGPLHIDVDSLKIGETPLSEFEGVEIEHRQGYADDAPLTLYPDVVVEEQMQLLLADAEGQVLSPAQLRTSSTDADELGVDLSWPIGITEFTAKGATVSSNVTIVIRYREVGSGTWLTPSSFTAKTFPDAWHNVGAGTINFSGNSKSPVRHGLRWAVPRGQYDVEIEATHIKHPGTDRPSHKVYWTALRTFTDEDPINSRVPVAKTAIRIKASDQLNGAIDEFNGVVTTLGKDWNGSTWVDNQQITNCASLFRHILQGKANAGALDDDRIDLDNLSDWHEFCVANEFTFNQVRTSGSVWDALADCAAAGRATPAEPDGRWGVVIDRPQAAPVSHITPRTSLGFGVEKSFIELPHGFRIPFVNAAENYRMDERRVYRDGYDEDNATKFEALEFPGVTDSDQIWKMGRYRLAQAIHQPERWSFRQDMEYLTYQRGDRIKITHDVLLVGLHSGRVKAVDTDASNNVTGLVLDETVIMQTGQAYGIVIRTVESGSVTAQVTTVDGEHTELTLVSPIPAAGGLPVVERGNIFGFGLLGQETDDALVVSIRPEQNFRAQIVAVPYREEIYSSDSGTIPPFDSRLTPLAELNAPVITQVISHESALAWGPDGSLRTRIMVSFRRPLAADQLPGFRVVVRIRPAGTEEPWQTPQIDERTSHYVIISGILDGSSWDIKLWFEAEGRLPGPSSIIFDHTVSGKSARPSPVSGQTAYGDIRAVHIFWDEHPQADFSHVRVEKTDGATYVNPTIVGTTAGTSFTIGGLTPGTLVNAWLIAVDSSGNEQLTPTGPVQATARAVDGTEIANGAIGTSKLVDASVISSKIAEEAVSVRHFVAPVRGIALNPDPFFMDPSLWTMPNASTSIVTITDGQMGSKALRSTEVGSNGSWLFSSEEAAQRFPFDPELTYRFSVWVRRPAGDGLFYGAMRGHDADGAVLDGATATGFVKSGSNLYPLPNIIPTVGWEYHELQFGKGTGYMPPTGTKFLSIGTILNYNAATGSMEIQDLRIEQVIGTSQLVDEAVIAAKIAADAVTTDKVVDGAVIAAKIANAAVGSAKVEDGAIISQKIANAAITAPKVEDGAIITAKLANLGITEGKLAAGAVTVTKVGDGAISTPKLTANAVTAEKIAAGAIITEKLAASAITGDKIAANTISVGKLVVTNRGRALNPDPEFDASFMGPASELWSHHSGIEFVASTGLPGAHVALADSSSSLALYSRDILNQLIPYDSSKTYRVGLWLRRTMGDGTFYAVLNPYDVNKALITNFAGATGWTSTNASAANIYWISDLWQATTGGVYHEVVFGAGTNIKPPNGTRYLSIGALFNSGATERTYTYIGSYRVEEVVDGSLIVDGAITSDKIAANTITSGHLIVTGANPIANPMFLTGDFSGWRPWSSPVSQSVIALSGGNTPSRYAVRYNSASTVSVTTFSGQAAYSDAGAVDHAIPVTSGKQYHAKVSVNKDTAASNTNFRIMAYFHKADGTHTTNLNVVNVVVADLPSGWTEVEGTFTVPAECYAVHIYIYTTLFSGTLYWTNVRLHEKNAADLIVNGGVLASHIATGAVETDKLAANAVTAAKILAGTITATEIATDAINASKIAASAVTTNELAVNAVTADKIAANAVTANKIAANSIDATKIAALTITGDKIAANTISASKLVITGRGTALNPDPFFEDADLWGWGSNNFVIGSASAAPRGGRVMKSIEGLYSPVYFYAHSSNEQFLIPLDETKTYRLSCYYTGSGSPDGQFRTLLRYLDSNKNTIYANQYPHIISGASAATIWARLEATIGPDGDIAYPIAGAKYIEMGVLLNYQGTQGRYFVSDFRLEEVVDGSLIVDGAITADKIAANAITADKIAANAVTAVHIEAHAVTASEIAANAVTASEIAANAVTADKIAAGAITTDKLVAGSVTIDKIESDLRSSNYVAGTSGWRIQKTGDAEFNGIVLSRQLEVASGSLSVPAIFSNTDHQKFTELSTYDVDSTPVALSAWSGSNETYLAVAGISNATVTNWGGNVDCYWGLKADILPLTRYTGNQSLRLQIGLWVKHFGQIHGAAGPGTNWTINWKIYKVT